MRLGVIADTHGLLRPEVFEVFAGVDHIIHAGDIGPLDILTELEAIAPVGEAAARFAARASGAGAAPSGGEAPATPPP